MQIQLKALCLGSLSKRLSLYQIDLYGDCVNVHKFARFLTGRFCYTGPELAGPERTAQSAKKEVGLARRRGGGASARKGGQAGGHILRHSPPAGRSC